jgi:hypothetical protein
MRRIARIASIAALAAIALALAAPIFADKAAPPAGAEAEELSSRLAELEAAEALLPSAGRPAEGALPADRERAAAAFLKAGIMCHDIQARFARPMLDKADRYLRSSLAYRESAAARAYLGSAHIIQARDAASVISKVAEANTGLKEVDAAVAAAPEGILVRAIRVECTIGLPEMFKRLDTVSSDLKYLLERYAASPRSFDGEFPPSRVFELKAQELDLRGKGALAAQYRARAEELKSADADGRRP